MCMKYGLDGLPVPLVRLNGMYEFLSNSGLFSAFFWLISLRTICITKKFVLLSCFSYLYLPHCLGLLYVLLDTWG